jgi:hypothetical protein
MPPGSRPFLRVAIRRISSASSTSARGISRPIVETGRAASRTPRTLPILPARGQATAEARPSRWPEGGRARRRLPRADDWRAYWRTGRGSGLVKPFVACLENCFGPVRSDEGSNPSPSASQSLPGKPFPSRCATGGRRSRASPGGSRKPETRQRNHRRGLTGETRFPRAGKPFRAVRSDEGSNPSPSAFHLRDRRPEFRKARRRSPGSYRQLRTRRICR